LSLWFHYLRLLVCRPVQMQVKIVFLIIFHFRRTLLGENLLNLIPPYHAIIIPYLFALFLAFIECLFFFAFISCFV
jgi:hypothetical protein